MTRLYMLVAAALLSAITVTGASAQSFSEPAAFQSQYPDRDVLNGGALTPAGRAAAGLEGLKQSYGALVTPEANAILSTSPRVSSHKRSRH